MDAPLLPQEKMFKFGGPNSLDGALEALLRQDLDILFRMPERLGLTSAWWSHLPFAHWVVEAVRPRLLVELGTHAGVSYTGFCETIVRQGLATQCFAIDTWLGDEQAGHYGEEVYWQLKDFHDSRYASFSSLLRCTFQAGLAFIADGSVDLLHIDGLHTYDAVREDFESWRDKLSDRAVVLFHDTNERGGDFGVWRLWAELRGRFPSFEFLHGHGLGVLAVGSDAAESVLGLCSIEEPALQARLRERFALIGQRWELEYQVRHLRAENSKFDAADSAAAIARETAAAFVAAAANARDEAVAEAARSQDAAAAELARVRDQAAGELATIRGLFARAETLLAQAEQQRAEANLRADAAQAEAIAAAAMAEANIAAAAAAASAAAAAQEQRAAEHLGATQAAERAASGRAQLLEHELATVRASTYWQMTGPLRSLTARVPVAPRRFGRRVLKASWWTLSGQLRQRLDARARAARVGQDTPVPVEAPVAEPDIEPAEPPAPAVDVGVSGGDAVANEPHALQADASPDPAPNQRDEVEPDADGYETWLAAHTPSRNELDLQRRMAPGLTIQPWLSILVPVFHPPLDVLAALLDSVQAQTFGNWELCLAIVEDAAIAETLCEFAERAAEIDPRIRVRRLAGNQGISGNSNQALEMARGDWAVLLDHDDLLAPDALFQLARTINAEPDCDLIYSDKDMIDRSGERRYAPLFKPDWSPDIMLNANFLTHVCAMPTQRLRAIGGWDWQTDGAQDWDLFLRVIGAAGRVAHIPAVLYHWRHIETSVSASGLAAKPYAGAGQLRAVAKHLPVAGWPDALPQFDGPILRIRWGVGQQHHVSVVVIGQQIPGRLDFGHSGLVAEILDADGPDLEAAIDAAIERATGSTIVLLDAEFAPQQQDWVEELALPLLNPAIAAVAGRVFDADGAILDFGAFVQDGRVHPAFRGESAYHSGPAGHVGWYRNATVAGGGALAFRRALWRELGGIASYRDNGRPDHAFTLEIARRGCGRLLLNPFAAFVAAAGPGLLERAHAPLVRQVILDALPGGDPFLNPHLDAAVPAGAPCLRGPDSPVRRPQGHDYAAEARDIASAYDATTTEIRDSIAACAAAPGGPLRRMVWLLPEFAVAFYGGIYTILRAAEHMRTAHGVIPCFAVLSQRSAAAITASIAEALPDLAAAAEVIAFTSVDDPPPLGEADAAICTLWITAYPLLRLRGVRRKFYLVQDWEPSFYPGGTISTAVEATYRFGFHAVCNTATLAHAYAAFGGRADWFVPAVDRTVFHSSGRRPRDPGQAFVLVCYARPNAPRNCFEAMSGGLRELKRRYGDGLLIVTVGARFDPRDYGLQGVLVNLGLLPYAETGALYRAADAGFVAMATRHPSYLPFELMACGAAVVTNRNPHTSWLLRDGENSLLCEMTRSDIAATVGRLIDEPPLRDRLAATAGEAILARHADWGEACEQIYAIIAAGCAGESAQP